MVLSLVLSLRWPRDLDLGIVGCVQHDRLRRCQPRSEWIGPCACPRVPLSLSLCCACRCHCRCRQRNPTAVTGITGHKERVRTEPTRPIGYTWSTVAHIARGQVDEVKWQAGAIVQPAMYGGRTFLGRKMYLYLQEVSVVCDRYAPLQIPILGFVICMKRFCSICGCHF